MDKLTHYISINSTFSTPQLSPNQRTVFLVPIVS